ncbi:MAG: carboxypeptidase-like regulatory domain-containing protein [Verrucomicrobiota bacterium]|nr:carboxypeptidase-like regulatory domain-containing protein [Verrucomicrobiota bacterium]
MKARKHIALLGAALLGATAAYGQDNLSGIEVTIKNQNGGALVYRGRTDAQGKFATPSVAPGAYSVEMRKKAGTIHAKSVAISISNGKGTNRNSSAATEHLQGGVAMTVDVAKATKLSGQITSSGATVGHSDAAAPKGYEKVNANVKVMNGKRYVWVPAPLGSNMGGKWVPEGSDEARLSTSNKKGEDTEVLHRIQDQAGNVGSGR